MQPCSPGHSAMLLTRCFLHNSRYHRRLTLRIEKENLSLSGIRGTPFSGSECSACSRDAPMVAPLPCGWSFLARNNYRMSLMYLNSSHSHLLLSCLAIGLNRPQRFYECHTFGLRWPLFRAGEEVGSWMR